MGFIWLSTNWSMILQGLISCRIIFWDLRSFRIWVNILAYVLHPFNVAFMCRDVLEFGESVSQVCRCFEYVHESDMYKSQSFSWVVCIPQLGVSVSFVSWVCPPVGCIRKLGLSMSWTCLWVEGVMGCKLSVSSSQVSPQSQVCE